MFGGVHLHKTVVCLGGLYPNGGCKFDGEFFFNVTKNRVIRRDNFSLGCVWELFLMATGKGAGMMGGKGFSQQISVFSGMNKRNKRNNFKFFQ